MLRANSVRRETFTLSQFYRRFIKTCNVRNYCGYLKNIVKIEQDCNVLGHRYDELLNVLERMKLIKKIKCHTYINTQKIVGLAHFFITLFCPNFICIMVCLYQTVGQ